MFFIKTTGCVGSKVIKNDKVGLTDKTEDDLKDCLDLIYIHGCILLIRMGERQEKLGKIKNFGDILPFWKNVAFIMGAVVI